MVTVEEMGAARHFIRTQFAQLPEDQRYLLLKPTLELNPRQGNNQRLKPNLDQVAYILVMQS